MYWIKLPVLNKSTEPSRSCIVLGINASVQNFRWKAGSSSPTTESIFKISAPFIWATKRCCIPLRYKLLVNKRKVHKEFEENLFKLSSASRRTSKSKRCETVHQVSTVYAILSTLLGGGGAHPTGSILETEALLHSERSPLCSLLL